MGSCKLGVPRVTGAGGSERSISAARGLGAGSSCSAGRGSMYLSMALIKTSGENKVRKIKDCVSRACCGVGLRIITCLNKTGSFVISSNTKSCCRAGVLLKKFSNVLMVLAANESEPGPPGPIAPATFAPTMEMANASTPLLASNTVSGSRIPA